MAGRPDLTATATAGRDRLDVRRVALVLCIHYLLLTSLDTIAIGFPVHGDQLGLGDGTIGLLVAGFTGAALVFRFLVWHLVSLRGAGAALMVAAAASILGPPLYLVTAHPAGLAIARVLHAWAPAAFLTGTLVVLLEVGPPHARGTLLGLHGGLSNLSFITAPILALWLLSPGLGAPWLYGVSAAAGLAAALLMVAGGLLTPRRPSEAKTAAPSSQRVTLAVLLRPGVGVSCALVNLVGMSFGVTLTFGALHALREAAGRPESFFLAYALVGALGRGFGARLPGIVGYRPVVGSSLLVLCLGLGTLAFASLSLHLAAAGAMMGAGFGFAHGSLLAYLLDHVPEGERWGGTTWFHTAFELGIAVGPALVGLLGSRFSLTVGLLALAALTLAGAVASPFLLGRTDPRESAREGLTPSPEPDGP